jgi:hypothetical protein
MASRPFVWLIGTLSLALLGHLYLTFVGSAVVVDETGGVVSAVITDHDGREQPLSRLWDGYFYAIPDLEGTIEIRCRDGSRKSWGYVTGNMHTKIRVVGNRPCERVIHAN